MQTCNTFQALWKQSWLSLSLSRSRTRTHTRTQPQETHTHSHRDTPASWAINRTDHLTSSFPEAREDGSSDFGVSSLVRINGKRRRARGKESSWDPKINRQFNRFGRGKRKKSGQGRIPPLFDFKKQHFDLTLLTYSIHLSVVLKLASVTGENSSNGNRSIFRLQITQLLFLS